MMLVIVVATIATAADHKNGRGIGNFMRRSLWVGRPRPEHGMRRRDEARRSVPHNVASARKNAEQIPRNRLAFGARGAWGRSTHPSCRNARRGSSGLWYQMVT